MANLSDYLPYATEPSPSSPWETVTGGIAYSDGNVGIGTESPSARFDTRISTTTGKVAEFHNSAGYGIDLTVEGNGGVNTISSETTQALAFATNGSSNERLRIDAAGNVGIGTDDPAFTSGNKGLHISGDTSPAIRLQDSVRANADFTLYIPSDSNSLRVYHENSAEDVLTIDSSGNLTATGNVTAYSDERLKDNVETLDGSKVYDMRGVSFTKDGEAGSGVIAQELQMVAPELVHDGGEYLSVAYGNLVGYLIEAVKDLKAEVEELKRAR